MKNRVFAAFAFLFAIFLLASCSGGSEDQSQNGTSQDVVQLLGPTPSLAGSVEVGDTIPLVPLRPAVTSASNVSVTSASPRLLAQAATATSSDSSLKPISEENPNKILDADRVVANPWQAKNLNDLKLVTLPDGERTRMPTGKWSKGFFY